MFFLVVFYSLCAMFLTQRRGVHETNVYIEDRRPATDRPRILENFKRPYLGNFMFGSRVRFSGTADRMALFPAVPNPRFGRLPSWKISNDHISGMSYPIHFHELQSSLEEYRRK